MLNEFWRKLCDITHSDNYVETFGDPSRRIIKVDNYSYTIDGQVLAAPLAPGVTASFDVIMDTDSDFVLLGFGGFGRLAGAQELLINPAILVQITDQGSGRNYFNEPAPMPMIAGQGGFPFILTSPRVVPPRTTLTVTFTPASTATFSGVFMALHGSRLFYA